MVIFIQPIVFNCFKFENKVIIVTYFNFNSENTEHKKGRVKKR